MTNKGIIQVRLERDLLEALNRLSRNLHQSRSKLIREACRRYIEGLERGPLDQAYEEGYRRLPEEPDMGEAQLAMVPEVLREVPW